VPRSGGRGSRPGCRVTAGQERTALVTGGTSGIGLAVAWSLAAAGHRVFVTARGTDDVARTVVELSEAGHRVDGIAADVRSAEDVSRLIETATARLGPIDILINNAGRSGGGPTAQLPDEVWLDVLDTNLTGLFRVTREVLAAGGLAERDWGRIVNVASTAGKQGVVLAAPYCASKAGVIGFTKSVGLELAKTGVTVNAVCPGFVETPMAQRVRQGYADLWERSADEVLETFEGRIPLGRYTTADEVAGLVGYLVTDAAAAVTAQAINVCGGLGPY
jgi:ketoreductase